jgi:Tfp pilus assembly protein PilN
MRPVNLIPPDARRGDRTPTRTGVFSYVVIGGLAALLLGVIALAFTSKQISDREAEVTELEQKQQEATARAQSLSAFSTFRAVQEQRTATVTSLAESRFDWERVLNELALVIPPDVWLVQMAGTVNPTVQVPDAVDVSLRDSVTGPALEIVGCGTGQEAVAGFIADLEDIDGVTRVGVASSARPEDDVEGTAGDAGAPVSDSGAEEGAGECRTRNFIAKFEIVVAFDEVPVPPTATAATGVPAGAAPAAPAAPASEAAATPASAAATPVPEG